MSRLTVAALALSVLTMTAFAQQAPPPAPEALDGVDVVVLLTQGKEVFGKSAHRARHGRFEYLFSSPETKAAFEHSPGKYAIQMGGQCARMGGAVQGNPSNYVVHEGKIYIFASDNCRKLFIESPAKYMPRPSAPMPTSTEAVARGRALLDKAAAAHGGATLDAVSTYVETSTAIQKRPTGDASFVTRNLWQFPGAVRNERTVPLAAGPMTFSTLLTPAGAWGLGSDGRSMQVPAAAIPALELSLGRQLVPVLRTRKDASLTVGALEPATVAGVRVDRVRVVRGGLDVTLNIDSSTGRVHSTSFLDRNDQGEVGEITIAYGDFRQINGLTVPFAEHAAFNGSPSVPLSRTLDKVEVNAVLDPALFAAPAGGGT